VFVVGWLATAVCLAALVVARSTIRSSFHPPTTTAGDAVALTTLRPDPARAWSADFTPTYGTLILLVPPLVGFTVAYSVKFARSIAYRRAIRRGLCPHCGHPHTPGCTSRLCAECGAEQPLADATRITRDSPQLSTLIRAALIVLCSLTLLDSLAGPSPLPPQPRDITPLLGIEPIWQGTLRCAWPFATFERSALLDITLDAPILERVAAAHDPSWSLEWSGVVVDAVYVGGRPNTRWSMRLDLAALGACLGLCLTISALAIAALRHVRWHRFAGVYGALPRPARPS